MPSSIRAAFNALSVEAVRGGISKLLAALTWRMVQAAGSARCLAAVSALIPVLRPRTDVLY